VLEKLVLSSWYGTSKWTYIFWPLMLLYRYIVKKKRSDFLASRANAPSPVPVIIVGNITVGGTGKTPVVQALVRYLQKQGYRPGIVSRGYGGSLNVFPHSIKPLDDSVLVGDEPYMLYHSLNVPVVIDPQRKKALEFLLGLNVDIVISDDGMQHYELPRDVEVCVLDGGRGLGNQQLLPVGPLREPLGRLDEVDFTLESSNELTNNSFLIVPVSWVNVKTGGRIALKDFTLADGMTAIAGIGNPDKFFNTLKELDIVCKTKAFPDHYSYEISDLESFSGGILMTEKDAVKIKPFARDNMWYLEIQAKMSDEFFNRFIQKINSIKLIKNQ